MRMMKTLSEIGNGGQWITPNRFYFLFSKLALNRLQKLTTRRRTHENKIISRTEVFL